MSAVAPHRQVSLDPDPHSASGHRTHVVTTLPSLERELQHGLLAGWQGLMHEDPLASPFQSPGWCLPWYRAYHDEFDPFVVVVEEEGRVAGLVPLATRRRTGEILFASGTMADYRDVVARPGARRRVVDELLRVYLAGGFPNPLQIGWIDPASDTPVLVSEICRQRGVAVASWQQPCHRWFPVDGENLNKKFSRVRTHLNALRRAGEVSLDVISSADEWAAFRDAFFQQHTLRQLQADRPVSFDDPRKRRFYDRVVASTTLQTHVAALRLDGKLLSGHVGIVWKDVLMLGAPSISLEHEQRSPSLVLLSWIMQNAASLGLRGLDLTIGDTEFKRRLGNRTVAVTMLEVYGRRRPYYTRVIRTEAVALAKGVVAALWGTDAWKTRVIPLAARLSRRSENGPERVAEVRHEQVTPADLERTQAETAALPAAVVRTNTLEDLLLAPAEPATGRAVRDCARSYSRRRSDGETLHTLVVGNALAGLCFSRAVDGDGTISSLHVPGTWMTRGARAALVAAASRHLFAAGCTRVFVPRE